MIYPLSHWGFWCGQDSIGTCTLSRLYANHNRDRGNSCWALTAWSDTDGLLLDAVTLCVPKLFHEVHGMIKLLEMGRQFWFKVWIRELMGQSINFFALFLPHYMEVRRKIYSGLISRSMIDDFEQGRPKVSQVLVQCTFAGLIQMCIIWSFALPLLDISEINWWLRINQKPLWLSGWVGRALAFRREAPGFESLSCQCRNLMRRV